MRLPLARTFHMTLDPETQRRKVLARRTLDAKWKWLSTYAPVIANMVSVGPTNPVEVSILREALTLVLAEMQFRDQETQELHLGIDLEGDGPEEPGTPAVD